MFARVVEFIPKFEKKEEFVKTLKSEVLPLLKKQPGFLEILSLRSENRNEKVFNITLWMDKKDAECYQRETFPKIEKILQPYLVTPMTAKLYRVETSLCEHFVNALAA
jgi:heme-degrading monooxygenase HmoA